MKIVNSHQDLDMSLDFVSDLLSDGIVKDQSQFLEITDSHILVTGIGFAEIKPVLEKYTGFESIPFSQELDPFKVEKKLSDKDKIGTIPIFPYENVPDQTGSRLINIFSENNNTSLEENLNEVNMKRENNLDSSGIAVEGSEQVVVAQQTAKQNEGNPAAGPGFEATVSVADPKDVERGNNMKINISSPVGVETEQRTIKVFADEMFTPEEMELADVEEEAASLETEFNTEEQRQDQLFCAKRKIRQFNRKMQTRRSFADELTATDKAEIIDDMVAILQEMPEIAAEVAAEIDSIQAPVTTTTEVTTPAAEEVTKTVETTVEPTVEPAATEPEGEVEAFAEEEIMEVEDVTPFPEEAIAELEAPIGEFTEDDIAAAENPEGEVTTFSDEEILAQGEIAEIADSVAGAGSEVTAFSNVRTMFSKRFSSDNVDSVKQSYLKEMREKNIRN